MSADDDSLRTDRRDFLGGLALGLGAALAGGAAETVQALPVEKPGDKAVDAALRRHIDTVVVIYAENRSFNCLFADFPGLAEPLAKLDPTAARQLDRDGKTVLAHLPPIWGGLVPDEQVVEHRSHKILQSDLPPMANGPFALTTPAGDPLPTGLVTRDLVHQFYENQMQINGGKNNMFAAWGDSGGLVMGYYAQTRRDLRLWNLAREFTLCDRFFMGAFGGSFLNHQYLIAAQPPILPEHDIDRAKAKNMVAMFDSNGQLQRKPEGKDSALDGPGLFVKSTIAPPLPGNHDYRAVNTMMPPFLPSPMVDLLKPGWADATQANVLGAQQHETIGDKLDKAGVEWAWYAGGWDVALRGFPSDGQFPFSPNFQYHHQPFNFFSKFAPGTAARDQRLRDSGLGDTARTNRLLADADQGKLPAVTFYKPQGNLNMHAGYSDIDSGDRHIAAVVDALRAGPQWDRMAIVITFDENGGWWDNVAPPKGDRWGPGTRVPALVISPHAKKGHVDHTTYDTGSVLRLITRRFGLEKLDGLVMRERAMVEAGGPPPGDLTSALDLA